MSTKSWRQPWAISVSLLFVLLLGYLVRETIWSAIRRDRERAPCERVLDYGSIADLTGGRTRGPQVTRSPDECSADYGAAIITLHRYGPRTPSFDAVLARLHDRRDFVAAQPLAGFDGRAELAELRTLAAGDRLLLRTLVVDRGTGWAELEFRFVGDAAIAGREAATLPARVAQAVRADLADPATAF